jgi:hypothetical protein
MLTHLEFIQIQLMLLEHLELQLLHPQQLEEIATLRFIQIPYQM